MTTQVLYNKVLSGEVSKEKFLMEVKSDSKFSSLFHVTNTFEDVVQILKNKGMINENVEKTSNFGNFDFIGTIKSIKESYDIINEEKKQKLKGGKGDKLTPDDVNYHEFQKGWRHELEHTEDIDKAKEIALDHLAEDPMYYTRLDMVELKASKKGRTDLPLEVRKDQLKDPNNQMEEVKKITNSNSGKVEVKKVEKFKKNVKNNKVKPRKIKVKTMKGGSGKMVSKPLKEAMSVNTNGQLSIDSDFDTEKAKSEIEKTGNYYFRTGKNKYSIHKSGNNVILAKNDDQIHQSDYSNPDKFFAGLEKALIVFSKSLKEVSDLKENETPSFYDIKFKNGGVMILPLRAYEVENFKKNQIIDKVEVSSHKFSSEKDYFDYLKNLRGNVSYVGGNPEINKISPKAIKSVILHATKVDVKQADKTDTKKVVTTVNTNSPKSKEDDSVDSKGVKLAKSDSGKRFGKWQVFDVSKDKGVAAFDDRGQANSFVSKANSKNLTVEPTLKLKSSGKELATVSENKELTALKNKIKEIFIKKLREYNVMVAANGPNVKKKELERLLQGYEWGESENNYQQINKQENIGKIMTLVNDLGEEGKKLFNSYAPQEEQLKEEPDNNHVEDIKNMLKMDNTDLHDYVDKNMKLWPKGSIKMKAAIKIVADKMEKDEKLKSLFLKLNDKEK